MIFLVKKQHIGSLLLYDPNGGIITLSQVKSSAFLILHGSVIKISGDTFFRDIAEHCLGGALDTDTHADGDVGYCQWRGGESPGWTNELGLLEGIAGIGMVLISQIATFEIKWDQSLLIA